MKYRVILFVLSLAILSLPAQAQLLQITTIAGNGETGYGINIGIDGGVSGDGVSSVYTSLSAPLGVAVDAAGNVYIQDVFNYRVRKVSVAGVITTFAGNGIEGDSGDGSIANSAEVKPTGIAVDKNGNVYIANAGFSVVRKVNALGIISRVAGTGTFGHTGDGGPATAARIGTPYGLTVDTAGNLYIADAGTHTIRKVNKAGIISTIAGSGTAGYSGDGDLATAAKLDTPYSVAVDRTGNVFISDFSNNVIRKVDGSGIITTYAGVHDAYNYFGDGGMATDANLNNPRGIAVDTSGNLYIADAENNVIRKVDISGTITTVVGNGSLGYGGDGGYALSANLHNPYGVAIDRYGSIYVADANNQRIRKAYSSTLAVNNIVTGAGVQLYPNPSKGVISVAGLNKGDKVTVYDLAGRAVSETWTVKNSIQTFDVTNITAGLYTLNTTDAAGNKKVIMKLVKE